jgi:hypothetical protein
MRKDPARSSSARGANESSSPMYARSAAEFIRMRTRLSHCETTSSFTRCGRCVETRSVLLVIFASALIGGRDDSGETVPAGEWAQNTCAAVGVWRGTMEALVEDVRTPPAAAPGAEEPQSETSQGRTGLVRAGLERAIQATEDLRPRRAWPGRRAWRSRWTSARGCAGSADRPRLPPRRATSTFPRGPRSPGSWQEARRDERDRVQQPCRRVR